MPTKPTYEELEYRLKKLGQLEIGRDTSGKQDLGPVSDLSAMIHGMAIPAFVIDNRHCVTEWNKACEKLTGFPASKMIGSQDAWRAFYPEKRPVLADLVVEGWSDMVVGNYYDRYSRVELVDNAFEAQGFFPHMGESGRWLYFTATPVTDSTGKIIAAVETFQDITKRKQIEEHHRLLLKAIPDPVIVYDPNQKITFLNEAFKETYGWNKSDLLGGKIDFVPPDELENTKEAWRRTLGGEKVFFETRRYTKDGKTLDIQLRTAILKDTAGNHIASIVIHRDITPLKKAEEAREKIIFELKSALSEIKTLSGLLPICSSCKKIRDDKGYWNQIETYISNHSEADFSHGLCPECLDKIYADQDWYKKMKNK